MPHAADCQCWHIELGGNGKIIENKTYKLNINFNFC